MERKRFSPTPCILALALLLPGGGAAARGEYSRRTPIVEAVQKTRAGIVTIRVEKKGNWGRIEKSVGTGVIVDAHGYIVSNRHVILGASSITVCLDDGT